MTNHKRPVISLVACLVGIGCLSQPLSPGVAQPLPVPAVAIPASDSLPVCVYVNSYAPGYSWSDGIERGLRDSLAGHCTIVQENMDTRTYVSEHYKRAAGLKAFELIDEVDPAIVITSDDNAAKYLVVPYLMDTSLPVVFSGINWTVEEYGFPVSNITGIVEVAPLMPLLEAGRAMTEGAENVAFLAANNEGNHKGLARLKERASALGLTVTGELSSNFAEWRTSLRRAQDYDFVVVGSLVGVSGWDMDQARRLAAKHTRRPTLTNFEWSMPVAHLGFTNINEEHGEWAGAAAIAILDGTSPADIPLATNRKWDVWINPVLIDSSGLAIDTHLVRNAKLLP